MITYLYIIYAFWVPIDILMANFAFNGPLLSTDTRSIVQAIVGALVWTQYFKKSVRVKNTFVNSPKGKSGYQQGEIYSSSD